jgi:DNA-binding MarR family transcriptional regulator
MLPVKEYSNFFPFDIQASAITSNDTHIFFLGGTNDSWVGNRNIFVVDKSDLENLNNFSDINSLYKVVGELPFPVYGMGIAKFGSIIYLIGGFSNGTRYSSILKINLTQEPFNISLIGNLPYGLENPRIQMLNDIIYIFGGANAILGDEERNIFIFNITDNSLTDTKVLTPFVLPEVCYFNNKIYLIGGYDVKLATYVKNIFLFDFITFTFDEVLQLPFSFSIRESIFINEKLIILNYSNSSSVSSEPLILDFAKGEFYNYQLEVSNINDLVDYHTFFSENHSVWIFGGGFPYNLTKSHKIFQINFNSIFGVEYSNINKLSNLEVENNNTNYILDKNNIKYNFDSYYSQLRVPFNSSKLHDSDTLGIKTKYSYHNDSNTRQRIQIGFTSDSPIEKLNTFNTLPSSNFIGIQLQNTVFNSQNMLSITGRIVKDKENILNKYVYIEKSSIHEIEFNVLIINETHFYFTFGVDGRYDSDIRAGSLNGLQLNSFSIWNQNSSFLELEGIFIGEVDYFSYIQSPTNVNNNNLKDLLAISIFCNLFIILIMIYIIRAPRFKHLVMGTKPEGVPNAIINLGFYNLYLTLKKAFKKIDQISIVSIEEDNSDFNNSFPSSFEYLRDPNSVIHNLDIEDMTGLAIKILVNLLDYLDHGTYLTNIQVNLGINRSSFYYSINKLKEKGYIEIQTLIKDDQRKKFVILAPKGFSLLKIIYNQLDTYFKK